MRFTTLALHAHDAGALYDLASRPGSDLNRDLAAARYREQLRRLQAVVHLELARLEEEREEEDPPEAEEVQVERLAGYVSPPGVSHA